MTKKVKLTKAERDSLITELDKGPLSKESRERLKSILGSLPLEKALSESPKSKRKLPRNSQSNGAQKGHGRLSEAAYTGATNVEHPLGAFKPGDGCPSCGKGKLFKSEVRKILVLMARAPIDAMRYLLDVMRCSSCGKTFEDQPAQAQWGKHHPSANAGLVLMRYGLGVPGYRLQTWQSHMGIPLPDATQWDMIKKVGTSMIPIFLVLEYLLAQSPQVSLDDTGLKVLALLQEFKSATKKARHGCHATCIHGEHQGQKIILYHVGRQHAGENIQQLLDLRSPSLNAPVQVGDGSACNTAHHHKTVEANCHAHAFRKFRDAHGVHPDLVDYILYSIGQLFSNDRETKSMGGQQRLEYHQIHSGPLMDKLKHVLCAMLEEQIVEVNSSLGNAITYVNQRWEGFTEFLRTPGVPLDNNETERLLKDAIRYRKNSGFFKTVNSARLASIIMSILATTIACGSEPMDYLTQLQIYESDVKHDPQLWLPWNYKDRLRQVEAA